MSEASIGTAGKGQEGEKHRLGDKAMTPQPIALNHEVLHQYGQKQVAAGKETEKIASSEMTEETIKQAAKAQQELARTYKDLISSLHVRTQNLHPDAQAMFGDAIGQARELLSQNKLFDSKQVVHQKTFDLALSALDPTNKVASAKSFQELMKNIQIG